MGKFLIDVQRRQRVGALAAKTKQFRFCSCDLG